MESAASGRKETLCPHCGKQTRTILGGCPECGGPKENPVYFEPRIERGGSWLDDLPLVGYVLWGGGTACLIGLVVLLAVLFAWELALAVLVLIALAAYAWYELSGS